MPTFRRHVIRSEKYNMILMLLLQYKGKFASNFADEMVSIKE